MGLVDRLPAPAIRWIGRQQFRPYIGPIIRASSARLRNRPRVIVHGHARGLRFNPSGAHPGYALGTSEPAIQDLFAAHIAPGSVVWDIGANVGFFTLLAARLVGTGRVIAFEPLPANVAAIERNLALNDVSNVEIAEVAIGDEIGTATLSVYPSSGLAKLETPARAEGTREPSGHVDVSVSTLDAQLQLFPAPAFVKIDIEGAEEAALRGAATLLTEIKPTVVCELHGTRDNVVEILESYGYRVTTVEPPDAVPRAEWYDHILATPS